MINLIRIAAVTALAVFLHTSAVLPSDLGFFRTIPVETPERGIIRMSSSSYHSNIKVNDVLTQRYGVTDTRIFSSITEFELGITDYLAFNGSLPYYADLFKQGGKGGKKTGAGDVVIGFRLSKRIDATRIRGFSFGSRVRYPEQLGYGPEPLGFRTFSYGKPAVSIEMSTGLRFSFMDWNVSMSALRFPKAAQADSVYIADTFYDTGFGYMGIGLPDAGGLAAGIFQDQLNISLGAAIPVRSWFTGILEVNATSFIEQPKRETILTVAPALRFGSPESFNMTVGMDFALNGAIPSKTFLFRVRIPTLSARGIKELLSKRRIGAEVRSRNSLIAVQDVTKSDITFLYENDLKNVLQDELQTRGLMDIVPREKVTRIFAQRELVPLEEKPQQLGVRLGANYLINTDVIEYDISRSSSLTVPFLISFPQTDFKLAAQASVTDLVTGKQHPLGVITAHVIKPRGINYFPFGESSDIVYISAPERRAAEKELIQRWVEEFNEAVIEKIGIFGWQPKQSVIMGDEETEG